MIFITVGTHTQSFNRLLKKVDNLVKNNKIKEKVIMQIGHSTYEPKNVEWFRFTSFNRFKKNYKGARMVITHGGAGSIIDALSKNKPVIVVPRLKRFSEHVNDHQLDLVKALAKHRRILPVYNIKELDKTLSRIEKTSALKPRRACLCEKIKEFLESLPSMD